MPAAPLSDTDPEAERVQSLTRSGRRALEREAANWERLAAAISRVVRLKEA
jgi:hypothetical protein